MRRSNSVADFSEDPAAWHYSRVAFRADWTENKKIASREYCLGSDSG